MLLSIDNIVPDPNNERKTLRGIDELAASLKEIGQQEPITVTPYGAGKYMLIAGERRWRAAPLAGLQKLEALIREDVGAKERAIRAMTSNLQREDTPPIERAMALSAMLENDTQEALAKKLGKSKVWMSEMLRILDSEVRLITPTERETTEPEA